MASLPFMNNAATKRRSTIWIVWILRIVVGATFILSGLSKGIDLWGFAYKIQEYFIAWGYDLPHSLYLMAAMSLSSAEFVLGAMLALGCYKRTSTWLLLLMMAGMLPLSLYIYIADPVADCGCFGDFWVISNGATFLKNIVLTAALVYLAVYNIKVKGLYNPYLQWIVGVGCLAYVVTVSLWGYNVQPVIDFRSFPVGSQLIADEESDENVEFEFVYEKDGRRRTFSQDSIPDSTWMFVDRTRIGGQTADRTELVVYEAGEDVTEEYILSNGLQLLIAVPDYKRAGISYTYTINELEKLMKSVDGSLVEIVAMSEKEIPVWRDLSMAEYPILQAEPTVIKELVRGVMGAVYLENGKIVWKRTLSSIDLNALQNAKNKFEALKDLSVDGGGWLCRMSIILIVFLAFVLVIDVTICALKGRKTLERIKKNE